MCSQRHDHYAAQRDGDGSGQARLPDEVVAVGRAGRSGLPGTELLGQSDADAAGHPRREGYVDRLGPVEAHHPRLGFQPHGGNGGRREARGAAVGRRPRTGNRPVQRGPRRSGEGSCRIALRLGCHRRRVEPLHQPHTDAKAGGRRAALRPHEQRATGRLGEDWRPTGPLLLPRQPDAYRLCRLSGADGQHSVLQLLDTPEGPAAAQHRGPGARRKRDAGLCRL